MSITLLICEVSASVPNSYMFIDRMMGEGNGTPLQYCCLEIPWMEEPGRLQSMGSLRVEYGEATSLSLSTFMHWRRKWQPILVFLPGESQGRGSLVGCRLWGRTELDTTISPNSVESREVLPNTTVSLTSQRHPENLPVELVSANS